MENVRFTKKQKGDKFKSEQFVKALEKRFKGNINNNLF